MINLKSLLRNSLIVSTLIAGNSALAQEFKVKVNTDKEPICEGKYKQTAESLADYKCPEWFRDAKFGIWAHWGPQCQPEDGDWYAREMYIEGNSRYRYQIDAMGHPSEFGFKDWIPLWKADKWEPEKLIELYKRAGAKYFFAMANHHDNFDMYDSKYQPWNSVNMGPKKDIIGTWAAICKRERLPFGVSVHASHAWCWMETSRGADTKGTLKGVKYDGWLTEEDGKGKWWEGYDIQDLYEQRHPLSKNNRHWEWDTNEVTCPDQAYCDKFYNRTVDLINKYNPDLLYYDDTFLPLYPVSDAGIATVAHMYNKSMAENNGKNKAVVFGKVLNNEQKKMIVWDVERGAPDEIQELPWQTCTCIGSWHYDKHVYLNEGYKKPEDVIRMLVDVVSKNGNLLLNVPVKGNGSIDPLERAVIEKIADWMQVNGESIFGTRPWRVYGEGPSVDVKNPINAQGFNEGRVKWSSKDIRFNKKGKTLYVTLFGAPEENFAVKSLAKGVSKDKVKSIQLLGSDEKVMWKQTTQGVEIVAPSKAPFKEANVYKFVLK
ncbi:alpha-L-fucosidase [Phocaeicola paurosaccharolyticus]|uniref:alpha-L-fucosidase n=1 Tax=Phocaeicola paurosaccharolyticus TaxID=732242 RepID=UPI00046AAF6F|nr:alpha-L-fucosidase [Phocaeicola paurosaccharolyticus]